jgi:hypothetical protein
MRDDIDHTLAGPRIVTDDIILLADDTVMSCGRAIFEDEREALAFEAHFSSRDGLIFRIASSELHEP